MPEEECSSPRQEKAEKGSRTEIGMSKEQETEYKREVDLLLLKITIKLLSLSWSSD